MVWKEAAAIIEKPVDAPCCGTKAACFGPVLARNAHQNALCCTKRRWFSRLRSIKFPVSNWRGTCSSAWLETGHLMDGAFLSVRKNALSLVSKAFLLLLTT
jgi:hypothetical protein